MHSNAAPTTMDGGSAGFAGAKIPAMRHTVTATECNSSLSLLTAQQ
jgi:hypothetical protein